MSTTNRKLKSWRDDSSESLSWGDVFFGIMLDLYQSRKESYSEYSKSVEALEVIASGFGDGEYKKDVAILEHLETSQSVREQYNQQEIAFMRTDKRARALSSLIARLTRGAKSVRQHVNDSDVVKEIAYKMLGGTGQNMLITGLPGSGKSWTALSLAIQISKITGAKFRPEHVCFTPLQFSQVYNDENLTPEFSTLIFDEAGVSYGARDSQTTANKTFGQVVQTIRYRKLLVILTTPDMSFIDVVARKSLHWWLETVEIDRKNGLCYLKPHVVDVIQMTGDILYPFPRFDDYMVDSLIVSKVQSDIAEQYEKVSHEYKKQIAVQAEAQFLEGEAAKRIDPTFVEYCKQRGDGRKPGEIQKDLAITSHMRTKYERMWSIKGESSQGALGGYVATTQQTKPRSSIINDAGAGDKA